MKIFFLNEEIKFPEKKIAKIFIKIKKIYYRNDYFFIVSPKYFLYPSI